TEVSLHLLACPRLQVSKVTLVLLAQLELGVHLTTRLLNDVGLLAVLPLLLANTPHVNAARLSISRRAGDRLAACLSISHSLDGRSLVLEGAGVGLGSLGKPLVEVERAPQLLRLL